MRGPHCPKCGFADHWEFYSGDDKEFPDALRCTTGSDFQLATVCGYIYWRRNAPVSEPTSKEAQTAGAAEYERRVAEYERQRVLADRRDRVRALVHSMLVGNSYLIVSSRLNEKPAPEQVVLFAVELDSLIELIEAAPPSDAGVKPLRVPCSHKYTTGEVAVSLRNGKCELCGNQVAQ